MLLCTWIAKLVSSDSWDGSLQGVQIQSCMWPFPENKPKPNSNLAAICEPLAIGLCNPLKGVATPEANLEIWQKLLREPLTSPMLCCCWSTLALSCQYMATQNGNKWINISYMTTQNGNVAKRKEFLSYLGVQKENAIATRMALSSPKMWATIPCHLFRV